MTQFILMFFPAFISISTEGKLLKKDYNLQELITKYGFYTAIINFIMFAIFYFTLEDQYTPITYKMFNIRFIFKYTLMVFALSFILGLLNSIISKYFDITLKIHNEEKNN